jgi:hypothetical protein
LSGIGSTVDYLKRELTRFANALGSDQTVRELAGACSDGPAQHPANEADNFCAICATIHLASSSFLPDAPLLPAPFASRTVERFGYSTFIFVSHQRAAFQSRAAPLA